VAHAAAGWGRGAGDEARDGLLAVGLDPARGLDLGVAADFADEDDAVRVRVLVEELDDVEVADVPLTGSPPMPTQVD
jgi:hypothetical protein